MDPLNTLLGAFLQFGAFSALVAWIVLRVIPAMQSENARAREEFLSVVQALTANFREEMRIEREAHRAEQDSLRQQIHDLATSVDVAGIARNGARR